METKKLEQESKEEIKVQEFAIVRELPTQEARYVKTETGQVVELLTNEEALKEILTLVRELKKGIVG